MPSELRIIRFRLDEVSAAVLSLAPRINLKVPGTAILGTYPAPDGTPNALLRYGGAGTDIVISNNQLAASLIAYCHNVKIELPREGKKSIQVSKDHIDLRINTAEAGGRSTAAIAVETETAAPQAETAPAVQAV